MAIIELEPGVHSGEMSPEELTAMRKNEIRSRYGYLDPDGTMTDEALLQKAGELKKAEWKNAEIQQKKSKPDLPQAPEEQPPAKAA
jgi:hypothetical protein